MKAPKAPKQFSIKSTKRTSLGEVAAGTGPKAKRRPVVSLTVGYVPGSEDSAGDVDRIVVTVETDDGKQQTAHLTYRGAAALVNGVLRHMPAGFRDPGMELACARVTAAVEAANAPASTEDGDAPNAGGLSTQSDKQEATVSAESPDANA